MPTAIEHVGAKIFLIHAPLVPRPFLTTVPFIASDFASWGYRVDQHASDSAYIAEVRARERLEHEKRRGREVSQRTKLMQLWAREIVERKRIEREVRRVNVTRRERAGRSISEVTSPCGYPDARLKKTGVFVHDFLNAINEADDIEIPCTKQPSTISPEASRIYEHVRHLYAIRYVPSALLPEWTHPSITYADMIVLEYRPNKTTEHNHFLRALGQAIGKNEKRMGKVESCIGTGATKVFLWIDVGDVVPEASRPGDAGDWDPVPKYERGEGPPAYV